jgi:hypothetical protein
MCFARSPLAAYLSGRGLTRASPGRRGYPGVGPSRCLLRAEGHYHWNSLEGPLLGPAHTTAMVSTTCNALSSRNVIASPVLGLTTAVAVVHPNPPRAHLIDTQRPSSERCPLDPGHGCLCFRAVGHHDEAEAPRPAGLPLLGDMDMLHIL